HDLQLDPAELRMKNLIQPEQFPYTTKTGWEYDSGDYPTTLRMTLDAAGYKQLRAEQAEQRARHAETGEGTLMGIGLSFFTEGVGAGPRRHTARIIAAAALECSPDDLEWEPGRWQVKGSPTHGRTIQEIALLAHSNLELPEGVEGHLDASAVYNPPNLTYPYGAYLCVVDV